MIGGFQVGPFQTNYQQVAPTPPPSSLNDPWPVHWPMPPITQAQLSKYLEQQRRAATRRAKQISAQVENDRDLRETLERALKGEVPIEQVVEEVKVRPPVKLEKVDWGQVKAIATKLLEKPLEKPVKAEPVFEALPDLAEGEIEELNEIQSLYAQDFYERLEALRRLAKGKLN